MNTDENSLKERFQLAPIVSGTAITVAFMVLIMSTSAEWRSETGLFTPAPDFSPLFWIMTTTVAWVFSLFLGYVLTTFLARPVSRIHAVLYGLTVWAVSYLLVGGLVLTMIRPLPILGLEAELPRMIWGGFFGDVAGMAVAGAAALLGSTFAQKRSAHRTDAPEWKPSDLGAGRPTTLIDQPT